ncbi:hypothetical protein ASG75_11460 [Rhodanobacter sp. Soil772]|nr:hypothetical protein ASG75_11460 [Rhodanobacter sp. Soil772]
MNLTDCCDEELLLFVERPDGFGRDGALLCELDEFGVVLHKDSEWQSDTTLLCDQGQARFPVFQCESNGIFDQLALGLVAGLNNDSYDRSRSTDECAN